MRLSVTTGRVAAVLLLGAVGATLTPRPPVAATTAHRGPTTPIHHLVVIYDENISFDHYFGTYPVATNPPGEPAFTAARGTPHVNGLSGALLTANPNATNTMNGTGATGPFRLDRTQASTSDQTHSYTPEQRAYDSGKADLFPRYTGKAGSGGAGAFSTTGLVMGYFDGNTVTALWNYAQHFAMSDNSYGSQYGPSTPGAINLASGQTNGVTLVVGTRNSSILDDGQGAFTLIGDIDPAGDVCSSRTRQVSLAGRNIGTLLSDGGVTWGWFQGGFDLTDTNSNGTTACRRSSHSDVIGRDEADYVPHHEPFQYYASTANPQHTRPRSVDVIGTAADSAANHQYDLHDFYASGRAGHLPAVTFLKAPAYQNAHAGNSDPIDEQHFVVAVINFLEQLPDWSSTAVIIAYDDSDGWYDHQIAPVGNGSFDSTADQLDGAGVCGHRGTTPQLGGVASGKPVNGRCGPGTRQPFLVISPWARSNYVDHTQITQASIMRFIEDNWLNGVRVGGGSFDATAGSIAGLFDFKGSRRTPPLFLDPDSGRVVAKAPAPGQ
ncbi:MAG TPA: alkaline phosphatase family protein [Gemmatimonadales bacterium]|jgi:phospholipase C|nr:alkaline phosphatase family protein [Gemmatimonadales bacterium]